MPNHSKLIWGLLGLFFALFIAAMMTPNLMRSRVALDQVARYSGPTDAKFTEAVPAAREALMYAPPSAAKAARDLDLQKKIIRNAELHLMVRNLRDASEQIRQFAEQNGGELERLEISDANGYGNATVVIRVPAEGLDDALVGIKKLGVETTQEKVNTRDVTREFYDNEAHLRNLRAEEQQYLSILKEARTIKDTLEVASRLSDVRDRIERLQTQIEVMSHDIAMSEIVISLIQQSDATILGFTWRPLYNAKVATHQLLSGLGEWADWIVAVLIKLPLTLLWLGTVGLILWIIWKVGRWMWRRIVPAKAPITA